MLLLLKVVLVPALVASVTLAVRRWGLRVGGVLTALPMVAGPTLCFYAIEQGPVFAAGAARTALLGIASTSAFCAAYAWTARVAPWPVALASGWAALAALAMPLYRLPDLRLGGELVMAIAALATASRLMPRPATLPPAPAPPRWDLALRMAASAAAVVTFTGLAAALGPRLSGFVSAFPVVTMILVVFTQAQRGPDSVAVFLRGLLRGLHSFAVFCAVFSASLAIGWAWWWAAAIALGIQIALQVLLLNGHGLYRPALLR